MLGIGKTCVRWKGFSNVYSSSRSTVFVEGDAVMNTYTDAEGKTRSSLSIYQSKTIFPSWTPCRRKKKTNSHTTYRKPRSPPPGHASRVNASIVASDLSAFGIVAVMRCANHDTRRQPEKKKKTPSEIAFSLELCCTPLDTCLLCSLCVLRFSREVYDRNFSRRCSKENGMWTLYD